MKRLAGFSKTTLIGGGLVILLKERVYLVDVPIIKAASVISKWGEGACDLVKAMQAPQKTP